jgi:transposase
MAVENGIKMNCSNQAVEGHINRIKSIKRQMYGRAGFELLRKKEILSREG